MALVFWGSTKCDLCGKILDVEDQIVSFPNVVQNESDPLYCFNDQVYHSGCLMNNPQWREVDLFFKYYSSLKRERKCVVCGHFITNPEEYLTLGFLTADSKASLFKYNFLEFHSQHFNQWSEKWEVLSHLRQLKDSRLWSGNSLDWIFDGRIFK
ncbi:hypothetical protein [Chitinophaga sp. OAE865]|uniref:hypothetical protein n=1 Tax=Chitinophaga sp. OAE865 TaxID=2817898 RepID=UPI001AE228CE